MAYPGQILIDRALFEIVHSHLLDYPEIVIGNKFKIKAKGIDTLELWELSTHDLGLVNKIMTPFRVYAEGRLSLEEKVQFMKWAESEIIEIGTGLTAIGKYFTGQRPQEFKAHIIELLKRGVKIKFYAVDPEHTPAKEYFKDQSEVNYVRDLIRAKELIIAERKEYISKGYSAELQYYHYKRVPEFHCICVDGDDPINARMFISPYLNGLTRAECPVYQLSKTSTPELFEKYLTSIKDVQANSTEISG